MQPAERHVLAGHGHLCGVQQWTATHTGGQLNIQLCQATGNGKRVIHSLSSHWALSGQINLLLLPAARSEAKWQLLWLAKVLRRLCLPAVIRFGALSNANVIKSPLETLIVQPGAEAEADADADAEADAAAASGHVIKSFGPIQSDFKCLPSMLRPNSIIIYTFPFCFFILFTFLLFGHLADLSFIIHFALIVVLFCFQLDDNVHKLMPRLPIALQEATSRMASRDPTARPTAQLLQLIKYFM